MIEVEVLFFARARELAGSDRARLELPAGTTVSGAGKALSAAHPRLGEILKSCRFAVNEEFANANDPVPDHAVIAVLPPVSGG